MPLNNQQSYSIWFKPSGPEQIRFSRIIDRDYLNHWTVALGGNTTAPGGGSQYESIAPSSGSYVNAIIYGMVEGAPWW